MGRITLEEITNQPAMWSEHVFPWRKILGRFHENWHWFTISSTLCIAISLVFLRYKTPEYKISASLLVKDDTKGSDFGDAIALESLGLPSGKSNVDNEVEILKSRSLTESVVNDLQLYIQYFAEGDVKTTEIYETAPVRLELINPQLTSLKSKVAIYTFAFQICLHFSSVELN
jgi:tyrosine-protein kinase Etk/Wzc